MQESSGGSSDILLGEEQLDEHKAAERLEKERLIQVARDIYHKVLVELENPAWRFLLEKGGIKVYIQPTIATKVCLKSQVLVASPPHVTMQFIVECEKRNMWDRMYETKDIMMLHKEENYEIRIQHRTFRLFRKALKTRVFPFVSYIAKHPMAPGGFIACSTSIDSFLAPVDREKEISVKVHASGMVCLPVGTSGENCTLIHLAHSDPKLKYNVWEKWMANLFSKIAPQFEVERLRQITRVTELSKGKQVNMSSYPPTIDSRDLSWLSSNPEQDAVDLAHYFLDFENLGNWQQVITDRGISVSRWTGPELLPGAHDVCVRLVFKSDMFIMGLKSFINGDKRVQWEPCATHTVELWSASMDHALYEVQGGGPGRGYGCPPFSYVSHLFTTITSVRVLSHLAHEARDNGDMLIATFPVAVYQSRASIHDEVSIVYMMSSRNLRAQSEHFPRTAMAHTLPLSREEYMLLESVVELRNVIEVDTWIATNTQLREFSMNDEDDGGETTKYKHKLPSLNRLIAENLQELESDFAKQQQLLSPESTPAKFPKLSPKLFHSPSQPTELQKCNSIPVSDFLAGPSVLLNKTTSCTDKSSDEDEEMLDQTTIDTLPNWVFEQILLFLGAQQTMKIAGVSRKWHKLCNSENIWRELVKSDFILTEVLLQPHQQHDPHPLEINRNRFYAKQLYAKQVVRTLNHIITISKGWKKKYCEYEKSRVNWVGGLGTYGEVAAYKKIGVTSLAVSPTTIAVGHRKGGGVTGYNAEGNAQIFNFPSPTPTSSVVQTFVNGSDICALYDNGVFSVYERLAKKTVITHNFGSAIDGGSISPTKAITFKKKDISVWDIKTGKEGGTTTSDFNVNHVFLRNAHAAAALCTPNMRKGQIGILDSNTLQFVTTFSPGHQRKIKCLFYHENETHVFSGCKDGNLKLWDMRAGNNFLENYWHKKLGGVLAVHVLDRHMVTTTNTEKLVCWDLRQASSPICKYDSNTTLTQIHIVHDYKHIFGSSDKGLLASWTF